MIILLTRFLVGIKDKTLFLTGKEMGSWSIKPFGNDTALDWLFDLKTSKDGASFLADTISTVADNNDKALWKEEETVAATAIVSAASLEPIGKLAKEAKSWIAEHSYVPDSDLIIKSIVAIEKIVTDSELCELWKETGSFKSWIKDTNNIIDTLKTAGASKLPKRKPKKKRMPRLLYKMIEVYSHDPHEIMRKIIHEKLLALEDLNSPSNETNLDLPLTLVAKYGLIEEASILLEMGADPNNDSNFGFLSPLAYACKNDHLDMVKLLLDSGAQLFSEIMIDTKTGRIIDSGIEKESSEYSSVFHSSQGLNCALKEGNLEIIDFLFTQGIDISKTELNGETLLHRACEYGNNRTVAYLIKLGFDVNKVKFQSNESPLHYAVNREHFDIAKLLLESGADPNIVAKWEAYKCLPDQTALDIIENNPNSELFKLIRSFGGLFAKEINEKKPTNKFSRSEKPRC